MESSIVSKVCELCDREFLELYTTYIEAFENKCGSGDDDFAKNEFTRLFSYCLTKCNEKRGEEKKCIFVTFMYLLSFDNEKYVREHQNFRLISLQRARYFLNNESYINNHDIKCKNILSCFIQKYSE